MRLPDLRQWNILSVALIAGACATETIPVDEGSSTGTETSGDGDATGDGDDDCLQGCCTDEDCLAFEYCYYGECLLDMPYNGPECFDHPDCPPGLGCVFDYCEEVDCLEAQDCGAGYECVDYGCLPLPCPAPQMSELQIPEGAQGAILDLQFGDLDDDGLDELVILREDELAIVDGDELSIVDTAGLDAERLTIVQGGGGSALDLVLSSSVANQSAILLGNGDLSFAAPLTWTAPGFAALEPIDYSVELADELLALRSDDASVVLVANLDGLAPMLSPLPFTLDAIDAIGVAEIANFSDDAVAFSGCRFQIIYDGGFDEIGGPMSGPCLSTVTDTSSEIASGDIVTLSADGDASTVRVYDGNGLVDLPVEVPGSFADLAVADGMGLVLVGSGPPLVLAADRQNLESGLACQHELDALPAATAIAVGNWLGSPRDELALVDEQGTLSLWQNIE